MQKLTRSLLMAGAVFGLAACGDDVSIAGPAPATITGVTVSPAAITIGIGETVVMTASVSVSAGSGAPATTVAWSSANAAIATVNATTGAVTGVAVGTTTIRAAATGDPSKIGASAVTVRAAQVQSVTVTPQSLGLTVGETATAVATVNRDAGVSGAVTWSTSNAAVATVVAGTGVITAVSAGTAVITATSTADPTKAAALAVTVSATPNNLTGLSVAPTAAGLGVGGTVQIVPNATTVGSPTVTYTYGSSNEAVATVSATGLVTAVGNGTAIITTTATTNTNSLSASTTITVASASVSISSITQLNLPVVLSNVRGQFEVTLNIAAGNQTLDSVRVTLGGVSAASQTFAINGAPNAPVTLSINSAEYTINADSTGTVRFPNGVTQVQAELFTQGSSGPSASNTIQITLTNIDTFHARWTLPANTATDANGLIWYGGPGTSTTVNVVPIMYSGNVVTSATINLDDATTDGNTSLCGGPVIDAASPFVAVFTCANVSNANVQPAVLSSLRADGNAGPGFVVAQDPTGGVTPTLFANASAISPVRIDVAAPVGVSLSLPASPDNWFNSTFDFTLLVNRGADPMDGVGLAPASTDVYSYLADGSTTLMPFVPGPNNIPEHQTNFTNSAYTAQVVVMDALGNASTVTTGTNTFGIDNTSPEIQYLGGLTGAAENDSVISPARDSVLHDVVVNNQGRTSVDALFGVRIRDTRSGFNVNLNNYLYRKITRLAVSGTVCAEGVVTVSNPCDFRTGLTPPVGTDDPTYRRDSLPVYGITGLLTPTDPGYYTYYSYALDRAGNVSGTVTKQAAIDIMAPLVTGINFPASLPGASSVAFVPNGSDDLEVISGGLYLYYPNMKDGALASWPLYYSSFSNFDSPWNATLATPVGNLAPFGSAGFTVPHGFLNGIDEVGPGNIPPATVSGTYAPSGVGADLYDIKRGVTSLAYNSPDASPVFVAPILPQQVTPGTPFSAIGVGEWFIFSSPPGTAVSARAKTLTSITNPPFPQVAFFQFSPAFANRPARWDHLGTVVANAPTNPTLFDQGTDRFWTYTLSGFSRAIVAGQPVRAVGMSAVGDGLSTGNFVP